MTKKEFIQWLDHFPEHTEIQIKTENGYNVEFTGEYEQFEFVDFKGNKFVQEHEKIFNKAFLIFGE